MDLALVIDKIVRDGAHFGRLDTALIFTVAAADADHVGVDVDLVAACRMLAVALAGYDLHNIKLFLTARFISELLLGLSEPMGDK